MPKTSDIDLAANLRILMKGRPGTRKTTAYGGFPGPIYVFMFDPDGLKPLKRWFPERTDIEFDFYGARASGSMLGLQDAETKMKAILREGRVKTVVIDSLTFTADSVMNYALTERRETTTESDRGFIRLPSFKEFNCENNFILGMLSFGWLFKGTFILCAHVLEDTVEDPNTKLVVRRRQRLVTGGKVLADKILAQFKERWHFEMEANVDTRKPNNYFVYTQSVDENIASTELPLPVKMDITKERLWDVMKRELDKNGVVIK